MLLSQVEAKAGIIERPADLFGDHRHPELTEHTPRKLAQRPADCRACDHRQAGQRGSIEAFDNGPESDGLVHPEDHWSYRERWWVKHNEGEQASMEIRIHGQWVYLDGSRGVALVKMSCQLVSKDEYRNGYDLNVFSAIVHHLAVLNPTAQESGAACWRFGDACDLVALGDEPLRRPGGESQEGDSLLLVAPWSAHVHQDSRCRWSGFSWGGAEWDQRDLLIGGFVPISLPVFYPVDGFATPSRREKVLKPSARANDCCCLVLYSIFGRRRLIRFPALGAGVMGS